MSELVIDDNVERYRASQLEKLVEDVRDLRRDVERLQRPLGCACPGDATPYCQNQLCPRRSIKMTIAGR